MEEYEKIEKTDNALLLIKQKLTVLYARIRGILNSTVSNSRTYPFMDV